MVIAVAALFVALSGAATATVVVTGHQIKNGSVAKADLTPALRAKIDRAATPGPRGPAGPAGVAGAAGAKGDAGAVGPSDTYTGVTASGTIGNIPAANALVVGTNLPAGSYLFQANVVLTNTANTATSVDCRIMAGAATVDLATTTLDASGGLDTQTVSLAGTETLSLGLNLAELLCSGPISFTDADFIATRVGTLH